LLELGYMPLSVSSYSLVVEFATILAEREIPDNVATLEGG
jgi:hypothetical protein